MSPRLVSLCVLLAGLTASASGDELLRATLDAVEDAPTVAIEGTPLLSARLLSELYAGRADRLIWGDRERVAQLLGLATDSPSEGFRPDDFHVDRLAELVATGRLEALPRASRIAADLILSDSLLRYVHHRRYGKLDPVAVDAKWHDRDPADSQVILRDAALALDAETMAQTLAERFPRPVWYAHLQSALERDRAGAELARLPPLPGGRALSRGARDPRVPALRERLRRLDDQVGAGPPDDPARFDTTLHEAVVAFQRRSGLTADGVVGPATTAALNGYADEKAHERIRINLERMRWLYDDLPDEYLFVDVAGFKVHLMRGDRIAWSTRVIVGTPETQTPMFRDRMEHLVFNPTWTVPASIQKKMGRVSGDYRIIDRRTGKAVGGGNPRDHQRYRLVQGPGPRNALGRVKFMFPNRHAVYLHDTPSKALFGRPVRALSNGCVRVQNPLELAEVLLEPQWDRSGISRVVERGQTRYVNLASHLPVLLYYLTAFAEEPGRVGFRADIYGRDPALREALDRPVTKTRIAFPEPEPPASEPPPAEPRPAGSDDLRITDERDATEPDPLPTGASDSET